jgi:hypothetical protein
MACLRDEERSVLRQAGFSSAEIVRLEVIASKTGWLGQARWLVEREVLISLLMILPVIASGPLLAGASWLYALIVLICFSPAWSLLLRRAWSRLRDPESSADRTLLALALRADPCDGGGRGAAFARLKARSHAA